jgi:hypothetical protein
MGEPPDFRALADARKMPVRKLTRDADAITRSAAQLGHALVAGGPVFDRLRDSMLSGISGHPGGIDGVILVRSRPSNLNSNQSAATDDVESGLLEGLKRAGRTPVVGVERSDVDSSSIDFFASAGLQATVDSIDLTSGRVALAYALRGAEGNFGIKPTADRLLPALRHRARTPGGIARLP